MSKFGEMFGKMLVQRWYNVGTTLVSTHNRAQSFGQFG